MKDQRITKDGVVIIKAQEFRSQEKNRDAALSRLAELIKKAIATPKKRRKTTPTAASKRQRLDKKNRRGNQKKLRRRVDDYD